MENLVPFLSYVFVVTFTPGPNNISSMANANKYGYKNTLNFMLGIFTGFIVIMLLCSFFNSLLFNYIPKIKPVMSIVGAGFMVYLAIKIMKPHEENSKENNKSEKHSSNTFLTGMTMQLVNPKVIIYGITVVSNFIIPYYKSPISLFVFSVLLAVVSFISVNTWAFCGSIFNKLLSKYERQFNIIMGLLLIYSAVSISGLIH